MFCIVPFWLVSTDCNVACIPFFLGYKSAFSHLEVSPCFPLFPFTHGPNHLLENKKNPASTHRWTEEKQKGEIHCVDERRWTSTRHVFEQDPEHLQEARTVRILQRYLDFNTLLLLGLSAGLLASCSSVISCILVVDLLHGTVSFVSVWTTRMKVSW